jgi:hypothetical protein
LALTTRQAAGVARRERAEAERVEPLRDLTVVVPAEQPQRLLQLAPDGGGEEQGVGVLRHVRDPRLGVDAAARGRLKHPLMSFMLISPAWINSSVHQNMQEN